MVGCVCIAACMSENIIFSLSFNSCVKSEAKVTFLTPESGLLFVPDLGLDREEEVGRESVSAVEGAEEDAEMDLEEDGRLVRDS